MTKTKDEVTSKTKRNQRLEEVFQKYINERVLEEWEKKDFI